MIVSPFSLVIVNGLNTRRCPVDGQVVANAAGVEKPLKISVNRSVPAPFIIDASRWSSRCPDVLVLR